MTKSLLYCGKQMTRSLCKVAFVCLLAIQAMVAMGAGKNNWRDPNSMFTAENNFANEVLITWHYTDDLQKTCESESRKRGMGGFGYGLDACSFWYKSFFGQRKCDIYTSKKTSLHFLGHEVRHCFQGSFH